MAKRVLTITPDFLTFPGHYTQETNCKIKLQSNSTSVYFKISCTLAMGPRVTPNRGMLKPFESCDVSIVLDAFREDPTAKNIRFIVEYIQKEDNSVIDTVGNVFKCFQGRKPFHLLHCKFFGANPFDEMNEKPQNNQFENIKTEVEILRKENRELKIQIANLNASKSPEKIGNVFTETIGDWINVETTPSLYAIEESIDNYFKKLIENIQLKKASTLQELRKIRESHLSDLRNQFSVLQQYKEKLNDHQRTISDADDNFKLEVHHDVHEFYRSRVDELSEQTIPEPRLYFRINLQPIEACFDANIKFGIET